MATAIVQTCGGVISSNAWVCPSSGLDVTKCLSRIQRFPFKIDGDILTFVMNFTDLHAICVLTGAQQLHKKSNADEK